MARAALRLPQNAPGDFFVDQTCIDCGTCRQVAPSTFAYSPDAGASVARRQPTNADEWRRAAMALVACPTSSIGSVHKLDVRAASRAFPEPVTEGVYYCGFASESSYGASSWLVVSPGGNVLVDSPRAARPLMDAIAGLGGVRWMFLTHRDDVADHALYARHFRCERILHRADMSSATRGVERQLEGSEPVVLAPDLVAIPVPGHTRGSTALLYRNDVLFTGDHLWGDEGSLDASRSVCWYSWAAQVASMQRLLDFTFTWVLPGHGSSFHAATPAAMRAELVRLADAMARAAA